MATSHSIFSPQYLFPIFLMFIMFTLLMMFQAHNSMDLSDKRTKAELGLMLQKFREKENYSFDSENNLILDQTGGASALGICDNFDDKDKGGEHHDKQVADATLEEEDDTYDSKIVEARFKKRQASYKKVCEQFLIEKPVHKQPSGFATDHVMKILETEPTSDTSGANYYMNYMDYMPKYNFLLCAPPKTGTTNWKKAIITMIYEDFYKAQPNHDLSFNQLDKELHWQTVYSITSTQLNAVRKGKKMYNAVFHNNDTMKIIHVRHPLERLYSAWKDKFTRSLNFEHDFTVEKLFTPYDKKIQEFGDETAFPTPNWARVSFYSFLKFILDESKWNSHWGCYWQICWPCLVDYDYITVLDTIDEDSRFIFEKLGLRENVGSFPKKYGTGKSIDYIRTIYKDIPDEVIQKIVVLFKWDFELFGFDKNL